MTNKPVYLIELLKKGGIYYNIPGFEVKEIIKNAVSIISTPHEITKQAVISSLLDREEMMPTAIGKSIAIPHPRNPIVANLEHESISICFLEKKINYKAMDGEPVQTLFIVLSANQRRHLEILSKISFLCQQEDFVLLLREQSPDKEIFEYVEKKEKDWINRKQV